MFYIEVVGWGETHWTLKEDNETFSEALKRANELLKEKGGNKIKRVRVLNLSGDVKFENSHYVDERFQ